MKSFNQFLQESYLNEEPAGRVKSPKEQAEWDKINAREADEAARKAQRGPTGAAARPDLQFRPQGTTTKVESPSRKPSGAATDPWRQFPRKPQQQRGMPTTGPSSTLPGRTLEPAGGTTEKPALPAKGQTQKGAPLARRTGGNPGIPDAMIQGAQDAAVNKPTATPKPTATAPTTTPKPFASTSSTSERWKAAKEKLRKAAAGSGPSGNATPMPGSSSSTGKPPKTPEAPKVPGKFAKVGRLLGPASAALDTVLSTADEKSKGSGWARSLAKGATVAAGGLLGGTAGAIGGGGLLSAATGTAGALAGGAAASKAFDTVAGANAVQRKAMATANRKGQAGGAIKGIGGKTTFDTKKNTITTGTGAQRKTAQLGKTSVITGPGGKQEVGNLAYKGGKAVYKRSDTKSLAQTSSNPLERIGRSLFAGAYKKSDAANAAKKLSTARASDAARNKALGVKFKPAG
jgi:hypothetical protein